MATLNAKFWEPWKIKFIRVQNSVWNVTENVENELGPSFLPCSGRPSFSFPLPSSSSDLCKQNSCRRLHSHFTLMWCYTTMVSADILTHQQAAASYLWNKTVKPLVIRELYCSQVWRAPSDAVRRSVDHEIENHSHKKERWNERRKGRTGLKRFSSLLGCHTPKP